MASAQGKQLKSILDTLEKEYGTLVPTDEPVEAGVLAVLAASAPRFSTVASRDLLREAFVNWNEARVADPWDIAHAIHAKGAPESREFARLVLRLLRSLHSKLNCCSFQRARRNPDVNVQALVEKMRGAPHYAKSVMLAANDPDGGWHPRAEVAKLVQKLGLVAKTTSIAKVARGLESLVGPEDRLRAHYLLTRYANRAAGTPDPLDPDAPVAAKSKDIGAKSATAPSRKPTPRKASKKADSPAADAGSAAAPDESGPGAAGGKVATAAKKPAAKAKTGAKRSTSKAGAAKTATKKPSKKKATTKQASAKKPAAKKTTAKKATAKKAANKPAATKKSTKKAKKTTKKAASKGGK